MKKKLPKGFVYFTASVGLVVAAIFTTLLINTTKTETDIRAKAGALAVLRFEGIVASVDDARSQLSVESLTMSEESRSGEKKNLGRWTVTAPPRFNLLAATPGSKIKLTVEPSTFNVASRTLTALEITILK